MLARNIAVDLVPIDLMLSKEAKGTLAAGHRRQEVSNLSRLGSRDCLQFKLCGVEKNFAERWQSRFS